MPGGQWYRTKVPQTERSMPAFAEGIHVWPGSQSLGCPGDYATYGNRGIPCSISSGNVPLPVCSTSLLCMPVAGPLIDHFPGSFSYVTYPIHTIPLSRVTPNPIYLPLSPNSYGVSSGGNTGFSAESCSLPSTGASGSKSQVVASQMGDPLAVASGLTNTATSAHAALGGRKNTPMHSVVHAGPVGWRD